MELWTMIGDLGTNDVALRLGLGWTSTIWGVVWMSRGGRGGGTGYGCE